MLNDQPSNPAPLTPPQQQPSAPPALTTTQPVVTVGPRPSHTRLIIIYVLVGLLLVAMAGTFWQLGAQSVSTKTTPTDTKTQQQTQSSSNSQTTKNANLPGLQLDPNKNYGDTYASGLLPVGDGKYTTSSAKQGYVYACSTYAQNLAQGGGGASVRGPWFTNNNTQYDSNKKVHAAGVVTWRGSMTTTLTNGTRTIATNDLPDHTTGIFPISSSDPAYAYDRNPNSIKAQSLAYALNASPTYGDPICMGGEAGVMLTGVAIFNGFDAGGRDAGAWEVQDSCSGHPEKNGEYHYHTLSSCIKDTSVRTVIGFALDGFPITGPKVGPNNILTTSDLDECHGITSDILLDGKKVTMYHYVMTQDFPYSISCFRSRAIQPPGLQSQQPGPRP